MSKTRRRRWPRIVAGTLSCLALIGVGGAGVAGAYYNQLSEQITAQDVTENVGHAPFQPKTGEPINILLMGSDSRDHGNGHGTTDTIAGARSDTTILLHISGDRTRAIAVSIPRDSMVSLPVCKSNDGGYTEPRRARFNEAYYQGGPGCTIKTVETLTGIDIHHYVSIDFRGFIRAVDAMNGIEICLRQPVNDPQSQLKLPAGRSVVRGEKALGFVRARYTLGDGGDVGRIERQQAFLGSAIRKATSLGVITNPPMLFKMLSEMTKSLTTDPGLASLDKMADLAINSSAIKPANIKFVTVPHVDNNDGATLSWDQVAAPQLWRAIRADQNWPPDAPTTPDLTVPAKDVTVNIVNSSGTEGLAGLVGDELEKASFKIGSLVTGKLVTGKTVIKYPPGQLAAAQTLQSKIGKSQLVEDAKIKRVTLVLPEDYSGPGSINDGSVVRPAPRTAADDVCS